MIQEKHITTIDIDPVSGGPLIVKIRAQFNVLIEKTPDFVMMENFSSALLPIFWFDDQLKIPPFLVDFMISGHNILRIAE